MKKYVFILFLIVFLGSKVSFTEAQTASQSSGGNQPPAGKCQTDLPFLGGPVTRGESFEIKIKSCFNSYTEPEKEIESLLKTTNLEFPQNEEIALTSHEAIQTLAPFEYNPQVERQSVLGRITYEICEKGTSRQFKVEKEVEFKVPSWMKEMADSGKELANMLVPLDVNAPYFPPSPAPSCQKYIPEGLPIKKVEITCVAGNCLLKDKTSNPAHSLFLQLKEALGEALAIQEILNIFSFPFCKEKTYLVTPLIQVPFTLEADTFLRTQAFAVFRVLGFSWIITPKEPWQFKHSLQNSSHQADSISSSSVVEIYGQKGVESGYRWIQNAFTPYDKIPR